MKEGSMNKTKIVTVLATAATGISLLTGCNQDKEVKGPVAEQVRTIEQVMESLDDYTNLDVKSLIEENVGALVTKGLPGCEDYDLVGTSIDAEDEKITVILKVDQNGVTQLASFNAEAPGQLYDYVNSTSKANMVLTKANLNGSTVVENSEEDEIGQKLCLAINEIKNDFNQIGKGMPTNVNSYIAGSVLTSENEDIILSVLGPIREDKSFIVFDVTKTLDLVERIIKVEGSQLNLTDEEIYQKYFNGEYTQSSRLINTDESYQSPAVGEVFFNEIYNQVFGSDFVVPDLQTTLYSLLNKATYNMQGMSILFADLSDENFGIYYSGTNEAKRTVFASVNYKKDVQNLNLFLSLLQEIQAEGSLESYIKKTYGEDNIMQDSQQYVEIVEALTNVKNILDTGKNIVGNANYNDFSRINIATHTNSQLPSAASIFGEKIMQDVGEEGTIIGTFIGDAKIVSNDEFYNDGQPIFEGADSAVSILVTAVYFNAEGVNYVQSKYLVPWYVYSTNSDLYNEIISEDGQKILSDSTKSTFPDTLTPYKADYLVNQNASLTI